MTKRNYKYVTDYSRPKMRLIETDNGDIYEAVSGEFHGKRVSANKTTWRP